MSDTHARLPVQPGDPTEPLHFLSCLPPPPHPPSLTSGQLSQTAGLLTSHELSTSIYLTQSARRQNHSRLNQIYGRTRVLFEIIHLGRGELCMCVCVEPVVVCVSAPRSTATRSQFSSLNSDVTRRSADKFLHHLVSVTESPLKFPRARPTFRTAC